MVCEGAMALPPATSPEGPWSGVPKTYNRNVALTDIRGLIGTPSGKWAKVKRPPTATAR